MPTKTKTVSASTTFNRLFNPFFHKVSQAIAINCKAPNTSIFLHELNFDRQLGWLSINLQPGGEKFNLTHIPVIADEIKRVAVEQFDAKLVFCVDSTELVIEGYYESSYTYVRLHFLVSDWKEFGQLMDVHDKMKKEEEEKLAIKREEERIRQQKIDEKAAEIQLKRERKLYEKLKKKFGDTP